MDLRLPGAFQCGIGFCWISATYAAYNNVFTSAWSTALSQSFAGNNQFYVNAGCISTVYLQIALFVYFNYSMEIWKQRSLASFDSLFIVPVFQALFFFF